MILLVFRYEILSGTDRCKQGDFYMSGEIRPSEVSQLLHVKIREQNQHRLLI
jgi:hypothetical protein